MALGWSDIKTRLALGELERADLVKRVAQTGDNILLTLARPDFPPEARQRIAADLAKQRAERLRRLDEIVDYCKTTHCRRRTVLDYFGDRQEPPPSSFCCDNCDKPASSSPVMGDTGRRSSAPMPTSIDSSDIYSVLQALDALRPALGKSRLNKLLRGTGTREKPAAGQPLAGLFQGCTRDSVEKFFASLMAEGLMHQGDEDAYFVCTITPKGRAAWQERLALNVTLPRDPRQWQAADAGGDDTLTELKRWRTAQAAQEALPPYCVFSDKTLMEIARASPQSPDALLSVPGIGPRKLEKYGGDVLQIITGK